MGKMVFQYDIKTPQPNFDVDIMIKAIKDNLPKEFIMQEKVDVKNLYFGIKAAVCQFVCGEEEGLQDILENYISSLEETGEWELSFTSRL